MNKEKQLIEDNNRLREKLSEENKTFYTDLLLYMRTASMFHDSVEVEQNLLQILQDILTAQEHGESAQSYFGQNPQAVADELLENSGKGNRRNFFKMIGMTFGFSAFFSLFNQLGDNRINFLVLILNGLLSFLFISIVFQLMNRDIYKKFRGSQVLLYLLTGITFVTMMGISLFLPRIVPDVLSFQISNTSALGGLVFLLMSGTGLVAWYARKESKTWWSFLPVIWLLGLVGIASKFEALQRFFTSLAGSISIAVLLFSASLLQLFLSYYLAKKEAKQ